MADKMNYRTAPVVQLAERLSQLSRVLRSRQVAGRYCSPFTYIPEGTPDFETFVGPQLILSQVRGMRSTPGCLHHSSQATEALIVE